MKIYYSLKSFQWFQNRYKWFFEKLLFEIINLWMKKCAIGKWWLNFNRWQFSSTISPGCPKMKLIRSRVVFWISCTRMYFFHFDEMLTSWSSNHVISFKYLPWKYFGYNIFLVIFFARFNSNRWIFPINDVGTFNTCFFFGLLLLCVNDNNHRCVLRVVHA